MIYCLLVNFKIMKKLKLLFFFIFLNIFLNLNAQTDTRIYDNKVILQSYQNNIFIHPFIFEDYDNINNLCFSLTTDTAVNIYSIDSDLNIINVINIDIIEGSKKFFYFKMNDKLYGIRNYQSSFFTHDSTCFYSNDLIGNNVFNRLIYSIKEDTNKFYFIHTCFLTKNKNVAIFMQDKDKVNHKFGAKLFIIDTLGQLKISKSLDQIANQYQHIHETDSNFTIINVRNDNTGILPKAYYIDKITLEIKDSASFDSLFYIKYSKKINDSMLIAVSETPSKLSTEPERYFVYIVNCNDYATDSKIKIEHEGLSTNYNPVQNFQNMIDFNVEDSIYYVCYIRNDEGLQGDYSGFIQIINFGINGILNFDYKFRYDSLVPKVISGVKATNDGGVLITIQLVDNNCWVMKFHPKGIIGLTNVDTGEKEVIKVYPNPAKDFVCVDIEATNFEKGEIELFDMQGKLVKKAKLNAKQGNRVDVSNLNAGAYTYNVSLNGKTISGKVIVGK